jgi:putative ABC transport system ATP-binding protein
MIKISNLTKAYSNGESVLYALNNVSAEINDNDFVVILGPSGSGKSTFLNTVSGLEPPDSGSIKYGEKEIVGLSDKELTSFRRENTAFIFQAYYLLPTLNVENNIKMGANLSKDSDPQFIASVIEAVGLSGKESRMPHQISGGEQQRVSIARALAKKPSVLFCDEPTGALDEATGRQILEYLLKLHKENNLCVVMVTHNANFANIATKVIRLNSGQIVESTENESQKGVDEIAW